MPVSIGTSQLATQNTPKNASQAKAAERSQPNPQADATLWLLLVGVNHYQDTSLPDLRYSAVDCQGLSVALNEATPAFAQQKLRVHHDSAVQPPTLAIVQASLKQIVTAAQPQDTILFYFSGHGVQTTGAADEKQQAVLCFSDTQKENLLETGLSLPLLLQALNRSAARQQLVWLDACHSGDMTLRGTTVDVLRKQAAQSSGFYALLSCDQDQRSWEFPQLGHGVFTYYLMQGLRGEAANTQGAISADSLYRYVYYQTLRYIDKTNQQLRVINQQKRSRGDLHLQTEYPLQTPKRIVEGVGESVLVLKAKAAVKSYPRRAILVDGLRETGTSLALSKVLRQTGNFEVSYWPQPGGNWADVRDRIRQCLGDNLALNKERQDAVEPGSVLLYLRGRLEKTASGEVVLSLPEGIQISRSWLRQVMRDANVSQQIVVLDFPKAQDSEAQDLEKHTLEQNTLKQWLEDLRLDDERSQCLLAAASTETEPEAFSQALLASLTAADPQVGMPAAGWITQLQGRLALSGITPHFWLTGKGVIEVLPSKSAMQPGVAAVDIGLCPYMGLRAFDEGDAAFFFGRSHLIQQLLQAIHHQPFLAVVGASGSGKSSVVQAGLMSQLRQGKQIPGSDRWWVQSLRPGAHPIQALAQTLVATGSTDKSIDKGTDKTTDKTQAQLQIEGLLHLGAEGFVRWLRTRPEPMVMLVIDQFEELFTLASELERQQFLALMMGAIAHASDRFKLVLTLRTDFMATALEIPELAAHIQRSNILVPPVLSEAAYREIILRPAEKVGLAVEPELVTVLLQDLSQGVGDLPLLAFVLEQIWEKREPGQLALQVYQEQVGGLKGALERKAQAVYDALSWEEQDCARWIFLNLTQLGEGTEDTRRRVAKTDLIVQKYPAAIVERTLQALVAAKLLVVGGGDEKSNEVEMRMKGAGGSQQQNADKSLQTAEAQLVASAPVTVEVAHEILIRHWSTLRWWLEENRTRLREQRQVEQAAIAWKQNNQQPDFLLRGIPLDAAVELYVNHTDELPSEVQRFVEAGIRAREQEQSQTLKRLKQAKRAIVAISVLAFGAITLGGAAYFQRQQARLREVETLNALSTSQLSSHQSLEATITAIEAGRQFQAIRGLSFFGQTASALWAQTTGTLQQSVSLGAERNRLEGHSEQVNAVAYSPNGELMASGGDDGMLKLWRTNGELLQSVPVDQPVDDEPVDGEAVDSEVDAAAQSRVTSIAFRPDSERSESARPDIERPDSQTDSKPNTQTVVVAHSNGKVSFWAIEQDASQQTLVLKNTVLAHTDWVTSIAYSPNRERLATSSRDGSISIWTAEGELLKTLSAGHNGWVNAVSWHQNGQLLASGGEDGKLKLWDIESGAAQWEAVAHEGRVSSVAFGGAGLVSAGGDRTIKLWPLNDGQLNNGQLSDDPQENAKNETTDKVTGEIIGEHDAQINSVVFSPDGNTLLSVGSDRTARIWPIAQNTSPTIFQGHGGEVLSAAWHPSGTQIASASRDKTVRIWQLPSQGSTQASLESAEQTLSGITFSPNGSLLAGINWEGNIELWVRESNALEQQLTTLSSEDSYIAQISFSPNGQQLASAHDSGNVRLWNLNATTAQNIESNIEQNTEKKTFVNIPTESVAAINTVSFSPNGQTLLSGGEDGFLRSLDPTEGKEKNSWQAHEAGVTAIAWHPTNNNLMASGSYDKTIKIWHKTGGKLEQTLIGHGEAIAALTFSPDGKYLISSAWDNTIKVWRVNNGTLVRTLTGHQNGITALAFITASHHSISSENVLVSGSADQTIMLWDWRTGERLKRLLGHQQGVESLAISHGNSQGSVLLGSSGDDLVVRLWDWDLGKLLQTGCHQVDNYIDHNPNVLKRDLCEGF